MLGIAAIAITHWLAVPLFGDLSIVLGSAVVFIALLTQRLRTSSIVCTINVLYLVFLSDSPYSGLIALIEFGVLATLQHHRVYLLLSSIFFWLCIGMPLTWLAINLLGLDIKAYALVYTIKHALTGVLCAALACMVYFVLPVKWIATAQKQIEHRLATNIFSLSAMTLILPTLVVSLFLAGASTNRNEQQLKQHATEYANLLGVVINDVNRVNQQRSQLSTFDKAVVDHFVVVINQDKQVIYASAALKLMQESVFIPQIKPSVISSELSVVEINENEYVVHQNIYSNGYSAYILSSQDKVTQMFSEQILRLGLSLLVTILIFLIIAHRLSEKMALPLVNLAKQQNNTNDTDAINTDDISSSAEINVVASSLRKSNVLLRDFEQQLQLQVTEKTEELEQLNLILAAQAREDGLTQLLNRSGFDELANNAIKTNQRLNQPLSLAIVDIDKFKNINDTYGHPIGDKCLKAFAALMQSHCKRETDIIGRYGGEEFVILMSGKDVLSHHQLIQSIHMDTQQLEVEVENLPNPITFTVSVGVCSLFGQSLMTLADIINIADEELYKCKNNGRNQMSIVTIEKAAE